MKFPEIPANPTDDDLDRTLTAVMEATLARTVAALYAAEDSLDPERKLAYATLTIANVQAAAHYRTMIEDAKRRAARP